MKHSPRDPADPNPMTAFNPPPTAFDGLGLLRQGPRRAVRRGIAWALEFSGAAWIVGTEGLRLLRREPAAAAVWFSLWLGAFLLSAVMLASGETVVLQAHNPNVGLAELTGRFGSFAAISVAAFLLVWATTTVAVYRAVLRSRENHFFYLRLGPDELRLAVMTVVSFFIVLLFGGAPAYLLFVLADPLMRALPALAGNIAALGAVATVCLEIWLGVRLSLISVETVAEKRFHLTAYWPLARGRFWFLLCCYFICFVLVFVSSILFYSLWALVFSLAHPELGGGDLWRRTGLLGLAGISAALAAAFSMLSLTIFCGCQAYAFGSVVRDGKAGVAIA
jgi:hypothetical protein